MKQTSESSETQSENPRENTPKPRRRGWLKVLKIVFVTLFALLALLAVVIGVALSYLQPERLTPIVEREASKMMNARLKVERVELSFYSTFPRFVVDVRGLDLRTNAFDSLPAAIRDSLPAYADSLAGFSHLNAAINVPRLLKGEIALYDIIISSPYFNFVQATPQVSGLDIFPPSDSPDEESGAIEIPDFSLGKFEITDGFTARYNSLPDSTDVALRLGALHLSGQPLYSFGISGDAAASLPGFTLPQLSVGIGGEVTWNHKDPLLIGLDKLALKAGGVEVFVTSQLNLADPLTVGHLQVTLPPTHFNDITALVPPDMRGELDKVDADFKIAFDAALTAPYSLAADTAFALPSMEFNVDIPDGRASYDGMKLRQFSLQAKGDIDGAAPDRSRFEVKRLFARGEGMGFELKATLANLLSDPSARGTFKGGLSVAHLPKRLLALIPGTVKGLLKADCDFSLRRSWLDKENFHRIRLSGEATLTGLDVDMPELPLVLSAGTAELRFGTNSSFVRGADGQTVDSLLTASLKVDTLFCGLPGMDLRASGLAAGIGSRNTGLSADTTVINPIGGKITADFLSFHSQEDSLRVRLRKASVGGALTRYKGNARQPRLTLTINAERAFYADAVNRAFLSGAGTGITVFPSTSPFAERRKARLDSLRKLYPEVSQDSLMAMLRGKRRPGVSAADSLKSAGGLDIEVDRSVRQILRRWRAAGRLRADRAMAFTPYFPLRTRVSGLDMRFNSDSVIINDTRVRAGHSDFMVSGTISNLTRALTSRRGNEAIKLRMELSSDSINVNEIAAATFAGAAFAETHPAALVAEVPPLDDSADTPDGAEAIEAMEAKVPADTAAVLVVPMNLDASISVRAANIVYSDLTFRDFQGTLNCLEGALNLSELSARTDVGSIGFNALYSAPSRRDASFAFGMRINDFHIREFLDLLPEMDSIMPMLGGIAGIINADLAATTQIDSMMNFDIPTLKAAVKISGDSLKVLDEETFRTVGKWLMFKNKQRNIIDSMTVEMIVDNSQLRMFPFIFNMDRYRLGVMGTNDLALNFNYHVAVLKSPLPFRFGINISGNPDDMKIRLGKAKFNEKNVAQTVVLADTTRINLVGEIRNAFRRGVGKARLRQLDFSKVGNSIIDTDPLNDTISHSDSLYFIQQGVLPSPPATDSIATPAGGNPKSKSKSKSRR